jgi:hypothetical protein
MGTTLNMYVMLLMVVAIPCLARPGLLGPASEYSEHVLVRLTLSESLASGNTLESQQDARQMRYISLCEVNKSFELRLTDMISSITFGSNSPWTQYAAEIPNMC